MPRPMLLAALLVFGECFYLPPAQAQGLARPVVAPIDTVRLAEAVITAAYLQRDRFRGCYAPFTIKQDAPASVSHWYLGLKLGSGTYASNASPLTQPWTAYTGGFSIGRTFAAPGGSCALQADALFTATGPRPWQSATARNAALLLPLYLRTAGPTARIHVLLGAGANVAITGRTMPAAEADLYTVHPVSAMLLGGLEVRLLPLRRYETTLAVVCQRGVSPTLTEYRYSPGGSPYRDDSYCSWLGATLNVYWHPTARPAAVP